MGRKDESDIFLGIPDSCEITNSSEPIQSSSYKLRIMTQSTDERKNGSFLLLDSKFERPYSVRIEIELKPQQKESDIGYKCLDLRIQKRNFLDVISIYDHTGVNRLKSHRVASFMGLKHLNFLFSLQKKS